MMVPGFWQAEEVQVTVAVLVRVFVTAPAAGAPLLEAAAEAEAWHLSSVQVTVAVEVRVLVTAPAAAPAVLLRGQGRVVV